MHNLRISKRRPLSDDEVGRGARKWHNPRQATEAVLGSHKGLLRSWESFAGTDQE